MLGGAGDQVAVDAGAAGGEGGGLGGGGVRVECSYKCLPLSSRALKKASY